MHMSTVFFYIWITVRVQCGLPEGIFSMNHVKFDFIVTRQTRNTLLVFKMLLLS